MVMVEVVLEGEDEEEAPKQFSPLPFVGPVVLVISFCSTLAQLVLNENQLGFNILARPEELRGVPPASVFNQVVYSRYENP